MEEFCHSNFWDHRVSWDVPPGVIPDVTPCFHYTALVWIPCGFLWAFAPLRITRIIKKPLRSGQSWTVVGATKAVLTAACALTTFVEAICFSIQAAVSEESWPAVLLVTPVIRFLTMFLALAICIFEKRSGTYNSGLLFLFWLLTVVCGAFTYRSLLNSVLADNDFYRTLWSGKFTENVSGDVEKTLFISFMVYFPLACAILVLNCFSDKPKEASKHDKRRCPESDVSFFSKLVFGWLTPFIVAGYKKTLTHGDLWTLDDSYRSVTIAEDFDQNWNKELVRINKRMYDGARLNRFHRSSNERPLQSGCKRKVPNILFVLVRTFGPATAAGGVLKLLQDFLQFTQPLLLNPLIKFIRDAADEPLWKGFFYALLMFVTACAQSLLLNAYFHRMFILGMHIRSALTSAIYRKALRMSSGAKKATTSGEIVNLMSNDAQKVMDLMPYINLIWSIPLQITLAIFFLWQTLGPAVLSGLLFMLLMIPFNGWLAAAQKRLQAAQMEIKDKRLREMNEILCGVMILKLYAWESCFMDEVKMIRSAEIAKLRKVAYLNAFLSFVWMCAPFFVSLVSFMTFVLISDENVLDPQKAFVSLALFNLLRFPLTMLPMFLSNLVQASVSIRRLNRFLRADELKPYVVASYRKDYTDCDGDRDNGHIDSHINMSVSPSVAVAVSGASFAWGVVADRAADDNDPTEQDELTQFALRDISMRVGCGQLVAIIGPVGSGKSSLLCAILGELEKSSGRVETHGSLAYVGQQAWIRNATVRDNVLFTSAHDPLRYTAVMAACAMTADVEQFPRGDDTEIGERGINLSGGQKQRLALARACYHDADIYLLDDPLSAVDAHVGKHIYSRVIGNSGILAQKTRILVTHDVSLLPNVDLIIVMSEGRILEQGTYAELLCKKGALTDLCERFSRQREQHSYHRSESEHVKENEANQVDKKTEKGEKTGVLTTPEKTESGGVQLGIYLTYLSAIGYHWLILVIALNLLTTFLGLYANVWLSMWSNDSIQNGNATVASDRRDERLSVYALLGVGQGLATLLAAGVLARTSLRAASSLHSQMLAGVLRSPMSFFDQTPFGRIINRFSKDTDTVDMMIPQTLRTWIVYFLQVLATAGIISYNVPLFLAVAVPLGFFYYGVQVFYVATSRQLKRLESVSRSPIYSHFGETLAGSTTIRAYRAQQHFVDVSNRFVDTNIACYYASMAANRWLAVRLDLVGSVIVLGTATLSVYYSRQTDAGTVGLMMSYALAVTTTLNWLVRMSSELEANIVAVERMAEYANIPSEAEWRRPDMPISAGWPSKGEVVFSNYSVRYRDDLAPVLNDVSAIFRPGEKIGVVGRTGAGKSTLALALFRILEPTGGKIFIDGQDISQLGLHDLREKLTIIPQDPVLFRGSLRRNLDPFAQRSDAEIWAALEQAHLKDFMDRSSSGLQYEIVEGGENLSLGQRQLVCLTRALLRKTRLLILDEATAAVDIETDELIQNAIRSEFRHCTVITIAHRLNTILDYDRIMVLEKGTIAEFDSPSALLKNQDSIFYSMAKSANLVHR